ncbi:DNA polymerase III subunit beta [Sporosarcina sp. NCCP-2222]|uniref:DNA polymerase III subunit beta n=1 Tax=Sporosarcina sp. NCCP-2222 TaxID=2935073 RepID=UPI00208C623E|nr:DNA polymerase III subunit beta [Sporosarcina sp. NCCP-2222]GKV55825.1 DNA polymerase III subunit beta [Sporosarcina sp. NCCP-2222]
MEFIIQKQLFSSFVSDVVKVCPTQSVLQVLTGLKIEAGENGVTLTGGNTELFIKKTIPLQAKGETVVQLVEAGQGMVPAKYFAELIKKMPGTIRVSIRESKITVSSEDISTKLSGYGDDLYPELPDLQGMQTIELPFGKLKEAISQTAFAVAKSDSKPVLTGVHMQVERDRLICTATDSHRLAQAVIPAASSMEDNFIVPSKALSELSILKVPETASVHISKNGQFAIFQCENTFLYSILLEGIYPRTESLLPTEFLTSVVLDTEQLRSGIDRACLFSGEWKHNNVRLEILAGDRMKITSKSTEIGELEEVQNILHLEGQLPVQMTFDGKYLLEALKGMNSKKIVIGFNGLMKPALIRPDNQHSTLQLLSPLRV